MRLKILYSVISVIIFCACSKKHQPQGMYEAAKTDSLKIETAKLPEKKKMVVKKAPPLPKVLTIDDRAAKRTADGRLYYDLEGKRYWRNYNDGKYYQFNKGMFDNAAFKPH